MTERTDGNWVLPQFLFWAWSAIIIKVINNIMIIFIIIIVIITTMNITTLTIITIITTATSTITPLPYSTPSEIPWRLFLAVLLAQEGNIYFTELAERVECGNYATTVGFHNFNLRNFNLRVSNPNKSIVDFFDTMSDFNVPGSRPKKTR